MKTQSDSRPQPIEDIGKGCYYVNMDVVEHEDEGHVYYEYDYVKTVGYPTYGETVDALIRERYTESAELAVLRQRDTKPESFAEYNAFCEACKAKARPVFYPQE